MQVSNATIAKPTKLAHFVLKTSRFQQMVDWYKTVLGAHSEFESPEVAFLTYDDEHHRVAIAHIPGLKDQDIASAGLFHTAFTFGSLGELLGTYERLKALGIQPALPINHGPTISIYYKDPDGTMVELQVDNFSTAEGASAYMRSPEFAENPIGVEFDPDDLLKRLRAGEPEAALRVRPRIGPRSLADVKI